MVEFGASGWHFRFCFDAVVAAAVAVVSGARSHWSCCYHCNTLVTFLCWMVLGGAGDEMLSADTRGANGCMVSAVAIAWRLPKYNCREYCSRTKYIKIHMRRTMTKGCLWQKCHKLSYGYSAVAEFSLLLLQINAFKKLDKSQRKKTCTLSIAYSTFKRFLLSLMTHAISTLLSCRGSYIDMCSTFCLRLVWS